MNRRPLRAVSQDDIARFKEDGAICIRQVFRPRVGGAYERCGRAVAEQPWSAALARRPGPAVRDAFT